MTRVDIIFSAGRCALLFLAMDTVAATSAEAHDAPDESPVIASRVLRKVDSRLLPLLFVTYLLNFMDKTILSSASVFGLIEDTVSAFLINQLGYCY